MYKTVLLLGSEGYIGHALKLKLLNEDYKVICIDNYSRNKAVEELNSFSATPVNQYRNLRTKGLFNDNYIFTEADINDYNIVKNLVKDYSPDTIVNLAQQPSAAYSHISIGHILKSTNNNINGTINCLYAIKELNRDIHLIQIGSMGEYDQSMGVDIEEGVFDFNHKNRVAKNVIYPRRAPSFYHCSKIASTYYIDLAVRCWGIGVTDIMQGVVYGNWTPEIEETNLHTRLDSDEAFGTVINRFIIQALIGSPLTVFGNGLHRRGFLALNDSIQCLMIAIENRPKQGEYRTWNQLDEPFRMIELANKVKDVFNKKGYDVSIEHIDSPRVECTDDFYYNPMTEKLKNLGFEPTRNIEEEIEYDIEILKNQNLEKLKDVVVPKIMWRK